MFRSRIQLDGWFPANLESILKGTENDVAPQPIQRIERYSTSIRRAAIYRRLGAYLLIAFIMFSGSQWLELPRELQVVIPASFTAYTGLLSHDLYSIYLAVSLTGWLLSCVINIYFHDLNLMPAPWMYYLVSSMVGTLVELQRSYYLEQQERRMLEIEQHNPS